MNTSRKIMLSLLVALLLGGAYGLSWLVPQTVQAEVVLLDETDPPKDPLGGPRNPERDVEADEDAADDLNELDEPRDRGRGRGFRRGDRGRFGEGGRRFGPGGKGRRGIGRGREGVGRGNGERPSPEEIEAEVMPILEEKLPAWHERFSRLKQRNPERFRRALGRVYPMVREFKRLREEHPELSQGIIDEFQIEHDLRRKAEAFSQAAEGSAARETLLPEIREMLTRQQELRLQRHRVRLEMFERRLQEQQARLQREKEKLARESENVEAEVDRKIEKLKKGEFRDELGPPRRRGPGGFGRGPGGEDDFDGPPRRRGPRGKFRERREQRERDQREAEPEPEEGDDDEMMGDE
jgi:hypothetical protein